MEIKSSALDRIFHAGSTGNSFKARKLQNQTVFTLFYLLENPKIMIFQKKKTLRELEQKMKKHDFSKNKIWGGLEPNTGSKKQKNIGLKLNPGGGGGVLEI